MLRSYMDRVVDPVSIFWTAVRQGDSDLGPQSVDCPGRADRLPRIAANRARLPAVISTGGWAVYDVPDVPILWAFCCVVDAHIRLFCWVGGVAKAPVTAVVQPVIKYERQGRGGGSGPHAGLW